MLEESQFYVRRQCDRAISSKQALAIQKRACNTNKLTNTGFKDISEMALVDLSSPVFTRKLSNGLP